MAQANYWLAFATGPGFVRELAVQFEGAKCFKCKIPRPKRSHHCSSCSECILQMDHHCPWLGCCVGLKNHGNYFRFLCYTLLCCCLFIEMSLQLLFNVDRHFEFKTEVAVLLLICCFVCSVVVVFLSVMAIRTFVNFCDGNTLIETKERQQTNEEFPFDLGVWNNLRYFLGAYSILWPLPQRASIVAFDELAAKTGHWPPAGVFFSAEDKHVIH